MIITYQICESLPIKSEFTKAIMKNVKDNLKVYYDYNFKGNKSMGFEAWYKEVITSKPER